MKDFVARLRNMPQRTILLLLMLLLLVVGRYVSVSATLCLCYAVCFPWAICQVHRRYMEGEFEWNATLKWMCAGLMLYVLTAFVTLSVDQTWALDVGIVGFCSLFALFLPKKYTLEKMRGELFTIACWIVVVILPFVLIALASILLGKPIRVPGLNIPIGIPNEGDEAGRIRLFAHPNITARVVALNAIFSIYAIRVRKGKLLRAFFAVNLLVNVLALIHTQSRTCMIAFSVVLAVMAFRAICLRFEGKKWRMIAGVAAGALVFCVALTGMNAIYKADIRAVRAISRENQEETEAIQSRAEVNGQFDVVGNGRGVIWKTTIAYMLDHPSTLIFGIGHDSAIERIRESYPEMRAYAHLHNSFMACLAQGGVLYLICILGFLCTVVRPAWRMLMTRESAGSRGLFIVPLTLIMLLLMSLTEEMLFTRAMYSNVLFYLMCGYALRYNALTEKGEPAKDGK